MKANNLIYVVGFVILVLVIATYLILNNSQKINDLNPINNSLEKPMNLTENVKERAKEINFTILEHNVKPQFKIGDKFKYKIYGAPIITKDISASTKSVEGILECKVEKLERINGTECYLLVSTQQTSLHSDAPSIMITTLKVWVDKDAGKIIKSQMSRIYKGNEISSESIIPNKTSEIYGNIMYYPWMLSLDDDFEMKVNENSQGIEKTSSASVFKMIGKEKINDRDCFKVELRVLDENKRVLLRENIWIDIKKRILVKSESYYENLKVGDINLIDYSII